MNRPLQTLLLALAITVVACGSDPTNATETGTVDDVADGPSDSASNSSSGSTTGSGQTEPNDGSTESVVDAEAAAGDIAQEGVLTEGAAVVVATGADITVFVDGESHVPAFYGQEPEVLNRVDGDGRGGLVIDAASGIWWDGSEETTLLLSAHDAGEQRLVDVAETSFGPTALVLIETDSEQLLSGFVLGTTNDAAFTIEASGTAWTTTHAALIGGGQDEILMTGFGNDCWGLRATDFAGNALSVPNVPPLVGAPMNAAETPDECVEASTYIAAWDTTGIVVVAAGFDDGRTIVLTAYDTTSEDPDDSWFQESRMNAGPGSADFLDIDLMPGGATTAVVADSNSADYYRFDPPELLTDNDALFRGAGYGSPAPAMMVALAPEFNVQLATPLDSLLVEDAPDAIEEVEPENEPASETQVDDDA